MLSVAGVAALVVVLGFAFMLGVSDAPNASAVLIASRAASYRRAMAFSFVVHAVGGLVAGQAVALTMTGLVHVPAGQLPGTYLAGGLASLAFTLLLTRRGIPVSASIALVGGLAGAATVEAGSRAVGWGGLHGVRPYGVLGTLLAIVVSPVLGAFIAAGLRRWLGRMLHRASRDVLRSLRGAIWLTAGLVGLADGSNDGQKAMGLATALLVAAGSVRSFAVPFWVTALVAVVLAAGTAAGGRAGRAHGVLALVSRRSTRRVGGAGRLGGGDPRRRVARCAREHLDGCRLRHDRGGCGRQAPPRSLAYRAYRGLRVGVHGAGLRRPWWGPG